MRSLKLNRSCRKPVIGPTMAAIQGELHHDGVKTCFFGRSIFDGLPLRLHNLVYLCQSTLRRGGTLGPVVPEKGSSFHSPINLLLQRLARSLSRLESLYPCVDLQRHLKTRCASQDRGSRKICAPTPRTKPRDCSKVQGPVICTMMNPNEWQIAEAFFPTGMGKSTFLIDGQDVLWSIPVVPNVKKEAWSKDGSTRISNPTVTHC
ncbi:hypothetical protein BJX66DRAFT_177647 [Aspergillus keveii]|uniref:Uncharacterized protein n=1 Tax=Aspergillus keveii TaxID=714993 RepID=A0ABR4G7E2_9EURO